MPRKRGLSRKSIVQVGIIGEAVGRKKSPFDERAGWKTAVRRLQFSEVLEHLLVLLGEFFRLVGTGLF